MTVKAVTIPKKVLLWINFGFSSVSQLQSNLFFGLNFWYQANPSTKIVKPIKYGLNGSSQEKVDASPLVPAIRANTGVMQQSEAAIAVKSPALNSFLSDFILCFRFCFDQ